MVKYLREHTGKDTSKIVTPNERLITFSEDGVVSVGTVPNIIDDDTNLWTVFARVLVNRETKKCIFLDYKTPDGVRMENLIKPTSFA